MKTRTASTAFGIVAATALAAAASTAPRTPAAPPTEEVTTITEPWFIVDLGGGVVFLIDGENTPWLLDNDTPLVACIRAAQQTCGEGRVCWVRARGGSDGSCAFGCQDAEGNCQPAPDAPTGR